MADKEKFLQKIKDGYAFKGEAIKIGAAMLDGEVVNGADIFIPLKTMNRHGLVAGATGTGKTKTIQLVSECLSDASIPVVMLDIKGDFSGIAAEGTVNDKITERSNRIGIEFKPAAYPVELFTVSHENGVRLRATVSEFGPVLLSKILGLNDTQGGVVANSGGEEASHSSDNDKGAVYRDKREEIHKQSTFCTHLGCVVQWNSVEKTWN